MTKEEYKKNIIRMWDSIRDEAYKGETMCEGVTCRDCPLYNKACGSFYVFEALEIVEQWAKEHPILTNAMKFKEVFGTEPTKDSCVHADKLCKECEWFNDYRCNVRNRFWDAEYVEPRKGGDE